MEYIEKKYISLCKTPSDIFQHLPTLSKYAANCESVLELGVRGCISSWAFVYGLINNNKEKKYIFLNDISSCNIDELLRATDKVNININYQWMNDLELDLKENVDLTFIDTWHVYGQLKRELDKFAKITNKYIIMHDTEVDKLRGETIRNNWNAEKQSRLTGIPISEINCGLEKAIIEFLDNNKTWKLREQFVHNNGLTILEKVD